MFKNLLLIATTMCLALPYSQNANATLIEFWNDPEGWQTAAADYNSVDFTDLPPGTVVTNQYAGFTVTNLAVIVPSEGFYGPVGNDGIRIEFDTPLHAVAVGHLGPIKFALYRNGELVATSNQFGYGAGVHFSGIISDVAFDEVYMFRPQPPFSNNMISVDNLYWGMPIPTPGAAGVLAIAILAAKRRRRP